MILNGVEIQDTFAEAFPMRATRVVITAEETKWARTAAATIVRWTSAERRWVFMMSRRSRHPRPSPGVATRDESRAVTRSSYRRGRRIDQAARRAGIRPCISEKAL